MADHFDHGLVVVTQGACHAIERAVELRLQGRLAEVESDAVRQVQHDVVALALHIDAGVGSALAQCAFLAILVLADGGAAERTDTGADQGMLAALGGAVAGQQAGCHADGGTDQGVAPGAVLLLGGVAVLVTLYVGAAGGAGRRAQRE